MSYLNAQVVWHRVLALMVQKAFGVKMVTDFWCDRCGDDLVVLVNGVPNITGVEGFRFLV